MKRITLGWLRIALAFMVVDRHFGLFANLFTHVATSLHNQTVFYFCGDGELAVSGFFILSGFLVAEILAKKYPSNTYGDFLHFVLSRYLRIFPLYLLVLLGYLSVKLISGAHWQFGVLDVLGNILLLPWGVYDFLAHGQLFTHMIIGPTWTLSLDLVFYPIGFILFKQKKLLVSIFVALLLFYLYVWHVSPASPGMLYHVYVGGSWWNQQFYTSIPPNLLAFVAGMVANIYVKQVRIGWAWLGLAGLTVLYVSYTPAYIDYFAAQLLAIAALTVIVVALAQNGVSQHESLMGSLTYAVYLVHYPTQIILDHLKFRTGVLFGIALSLILAVLLAVFVEERLVESRRRRWLNAWKPDVQGQPMHYRFLSFVVLSMLMVSMWMHISSL